MPKDKSVLVRPRKNNLPDNFAIQSGESFDPQNADSLPQEADSCGLEIAEELISIPLSDLLPDPNQARHDFSKISAIKESIKLNGLLQPITVIKNSEGKYEIKDGECRWRAMKLLALENGQDLSSVKIKAICKHGEIDENIGLIINLIRNNYSPFEVALALKKLQDSDPKLTLEKIGRYIGKSRQNVGEYLNLLRLPEKIRDHAIENNIVPFYLLKQLAANPRLSEDDKIGEYDKLVAIHSNQSLIDDMPSEQANPLIGREGKEIAPQNKKLNVINKKMDTLIKSFEKFKTETVENAEDRQSLSKKLETIIANASELKNKLDKEN